MSEEVEEALHTHCTHIAHTLHTHCTHIAHTLHTHCTHIAHTLHTHCTHIAHTLHTHCTHIAHTLHTHCTHIAHTLKGGKSSGADYIPTELKLGGPEMIKVLTTLRQRIWKTKEWPKEWTHATPKKGNLRLCRNDRTISLTSHAPGHLEQTQSKGLIQIIRALYANSQCCPSKQPTWRTFQDNCRSSSRMPTLACSLQHIPRGHQETLQNVNIMQETLQNVNITQETLQNVKERKQIQPWITNDILDFCGTGRNLKKTNNSTPETAQHRTVNHQNGDDKSKRGMDLRAM